MGVCLTSPHVLCGSGEGIRPCPSWYSVGSDPRVWGPGDFWTGCLPSEVFQACPTGKEALGKTQDTLERLCLSAGLGTPQGPPEELEEVSGPGHTAILTIILLIRLKDSALLLLSVVTCCTLVTPLSCCFDNCSPSAEEDRVR
ncbi:hypothetical protein L3Q82_001368 [Scortum barcoo]|uniref:Uncharacterized protein n=1 Tax=Scortum barcoo TaxID=214431 RepID=A0ACB8W7H9_9TELE|nr:hypothetical protein L3Q82_001368 [Scortum barcoo]